MVPINLKTFIANHHSMAIRGVAYRMGAKAEPSAFDSLENAQRAMRTIEYCDCSGYMRLMVYAATDGKVLMPDGSATQREWMEKEGFVKTTPYSRESSVPGDQTLYINFIAPTDAHAGHIWAVQDRETVECCGAGGVLSRPWNTRPLPQEWAAAFAWPHVWI